MEGWLQCCPRAPPHPSPLPSRCRTASLGPLHPALSVPPALGCVTPPPSPSWVQRSPPLFPPDLPRTLVIRRSWETSASQEVTVLQAVMTQRGPHGFLSATPTSTPSPEEQRLQAPKCAPHLSLKGYPPPAWAPTPSPKSSGRWGELLWPSMRHGRGGESKPQTGPPLPRSPSLQKNRAKNCHIISEQ